MIEFPVHLRRNWWKYLVLAVLAGVAVALILTTSPQDLLSIDAIAMQYGELSAAIAERPVLAGSIALAAYVVFVALAVPGVWIMSVAYGLLFGWMLGLPLVLAGAVLGGSILYWAARTALGGFFRARSGEALKKMAVGFQRNAASYLLFLRIMPMFPFVVINVVPGVIGIPYRTFLWTSLVGLLPSSLAYTFAGEQLGSFVAERAEACAEDAPPCGDPLSVWDVLSTELILALAALAAVALVPVVIQRVRTR